MHLKTDLTDIHEKKSKLYRRGFSSQPISYFRSSLPRRRYYDEKNIYFAFFFENLIKN